MSRKSFEQRKLDALKKLLVGAEKDKSDLLKDLSALNEELNEADKVLEQLRQEISALEGAGS